MHCSSRHLRVHNPIATPLAHRSACLQHASPPAARVRHVHHSRTALARPTASLLVLAYHVPRTSLAHNTQPAPGPLSPSSAPHLFLQPFLRSAESTRLPYPPRHPLGPAIRQHSTSSTFLPSPSTHLPAQFTPFCRTSHRHPARIPPTPLPFNLPIPSGINHSHPPTHARARERARTHTCTAHTPHTHIHSTQPALSHTRSLLSLSLTHTHAHTPHAHTHMHTHMHARMHARMHTFTPLHSHLFIHTYSFIPLRSHTTFTPLHNWCF